MCGSARLTPLRIGSIENKRAIVGLALQGCKTGPAIYSKDGIMSSAGVPSQAGGAAPGTPFAVPEIALLAGQLQSSAGPGGLAYNFNNSLGCAIATNAVLLTFAGGATQQLPTQSLSNQCDTTGGAFTVLLPKIGSIGVTLELVKVSSDANTLTIQCAAGDTFADGTTTFVLFNQNDYADYLVNLTKGIWALRGFRQKSLPNANGVAIPAGAASIIANNTGQVVSNNTTTTLSCSVKIFDSGVPSPYWNSASPNQLVAPRAGVYSITGCAMFTATTEASGTLQMYLNVGGTVIAVGSGAVSPPGSNLVAAVSAIAQISSGTAMVLQVYQNTGAPLNVFTTGATVPPTFSIVQVA